MFNSWSSFGTWNSRLVHDGLLWASLSLCLSVCLSLFLYLSLSLFVIYLESFCLCSSAWEGDLLLASSSSPLFREEDGASVNSYSQTMTTKKLICHITLHQYKSILDLNVFVFEKRWSHMQDMHNYSREIALMLRESHLFLEEHW